MYLGRTGKPVAVGSERRRQSGTGIRRSDHITPVLRQLHWLPVRQSVDFKVATLVHRSRKTLTMIFFSRVLHNENHVLHPLLPERNDHG